MSVARHESVAGQIGARTEWWRDLAYIGGDTWADLLCRWADRQEDPVAEIEALLTVAAHGGREAASDFYRERVTAERAQVRQGAIDDAVELIALAYEVHER